MFNNYNNNEENNNKFLIIKNLSKNIKENQLIETFKSLGKIISCEIPYFINQKGEKENYDFGFLELNDNETCDNIIKIYSNSIFNDQEISFEKVNDKSLKHNYGQFTCLNLIGLNPRKIKTHEDLEMFLKNFGQVEVSRLSYYEYHGDIKLIGFCIMKNHFEALNIIKKLNNFKDGIYLLKVFPTKLNLNLIKIKNTLLLNKFNYN